MTMTVASLTSWTFRIAPAPGGDQQVLAAVLLSAADGRALSEALAWLRHRDYLAPAVESADQILALRALTALIDQIDGLVDDGHGAPIEFMQEQVALLAEAAVRYAAERDAEDGYVAPSDRDRVARLRILSHRLFDLSADFAGAVAEARQPH
jgi:hypothetical protein